MTINDYGGDKNGHWKQCRYCFGYVQLQIDGQPTGNVMQHGNGCPVARLEALQAKYKALEQAAQIEHAQLAACARERDEVQVRTRIANIIWSKFTEIGGGKCYITSNLDDLAQEIVEALR